MGALGSPILSGLALLAGLHRLDLPAQFFTRYILACTLSHTGRLFCVWVLMLMHDVCCMLYISQFVTLIVFPEVVTAGWCWVNVCDGEFLPVFLLVISVGGLGFGRLCLWP